MNTSAYSSTVFSEMPAINGKCETAHTSCNHPWLFGTDCRCQACRLLPRYADHLLTEFGLLLNAKRINMQLISSRAFF